MGFARVDPVARGNIALARRGSAIGGDYVTAVAVVSLVLEEQQQEILSLVL